MNRQTAHVVDRAFVEGEIERLIALLDRLDGDPDLELEEDCCEAHDDGPRPWFFADAGPGDPDDAEDSPDREEDPAEAGMCRPDLPAELGSASCRERVCQYV